MVPGECNAFFTCNTNGDFQKSYCSEGLHWSQETLSCGWASESDCVNDPNVPNVFYREGQACSATGGFAPNPADCSSFLICNHDKYVVKPCGDGLHWDNKIKACNFIDLAGCQPGSVQAQGQGSAVPDVVTESTTTTLSTTTTQWTQGDNDYDSGDYNPGQWEWKPPTTTTTETTFIETSDVQQPLSGDYKVKKNICV